VGSYKRAEKEEERRRKWEVPVQLIHAPKAFANPSPGFEHRENPGTDIKKDV
jgi:hypothetical protein